MKKTVKAGLFVLFTVMTACNKESNSTPGTLGATTGGGYYMRFKSNGTQVNYTDTWVKLEMGDLPPYHTAYFTSGITGVINKSSFSFRLYDSAAIQESATYTQAVFPPTTLARAYCDYVDADSAQFLSCKNSTAIYPFTVTITAISDTSVSGTFSGQAKAISDSAIINITEGEFNLLKK